ncbi:MAG: hypothetical protein ACK42G_07020 [Candidatus Kapaibacteriota bacterium]
MLINENLKFSHTKESSSGKEPYLETFVGIEVYLSKSKSSSNSSPMSSSSMN